MTVYKAVPDNMSSAVPSFAGGDSPISKTAAQLGWGPAEYGSGVSLKQPVPGPATNSPVTAPQVGVPVTNDALKNASRAGAVGSLPGPGEYGMFVPGVAFRGKGAPQGQGNTLQPIPDGYPGSWTDDNEFVTNDLHSQDTDTHGWFQLHPNNRFARFLTFGQSNPINNPTWMGQQENVTNAPLANPGVDYTAYENDNVGGFNIGDGTRNFNWMADGQNVAYQAPAPPAMTTTDSYTQDTYELGVDFA
jgi:hypothetical protein